MSKIGNIFRARHRRKITILFLLLAAMFLGLLGRLTWLMIWRHEYYSALATELRSRTYSGPEWDGAGGQ